jgi:hypothetical protein
MLELAAERGLLDMPVAIAKLQATFFYVPATIIQKMLARDAAGKGKTLWKGHQCVNHPAFS